MLPLVFELYSLRHFTPYWSCEGHRVPGRQGANVPEVRFVAEHLAHLSVLAEAVAARGRWTMTVVADPAAPGPAFALRSCDSDELAHARERVVALAVGLAADVRERAAAAYQRDPQVVLEAGGKRLATSRAPDHAPSGLGALSEREKQVLAGFLQGYSVATLSEQLFISRFTVRNHIKNICAKLLLPSQRALRERFATSAIFWRE